jgi:hypothetical protein
MELEVTLSDAGSLRNLCQILSRVGCLVNRTSATSTLVSAPFPSHRGVLLFVDLLDAWSKLHPGLRLDVRVSALA